MSDNNKEIAADAARLKKYFAQRTADDAKIEERVQVKQAERNATSSRPQPRAELLGHVINHNRNEANLCWDYAQMVLRLGGLEAVAYLPKPVLISRVWPGGHITDSTSPFATDWLITTLLAEAFTAGVLEHLPADPPDVLPMAERQAKLAEIDRELAELAAQRKAIAAELAEELSFTKEAAA